MMPEAYDVEYVHHGEVALPIPAVRTILQVMERLRVLS
jgi:hypothetical protein